MTYVFDIDGTICSLTNGDYKEAEPFYDRIKKINDFIYNFATSDIWIYCFIDVKMEQ